MAITGLRGEIEEIRGSRDLGKMWSTGGRGSVRLWQRGAKEIISLGLFDAFGQYDRHSWTSLGTGAADIHKKVVLALFLAGVGKDLESEGWNEVRDEVVTHEVLSKYQSGVLCDPSRGEIGRSALALDAVFVACLLMHRMWNSGRHRISERSSMTSCARFLCRKLQPMFAFLSVIDRQNIDDLFEETFRIENQIPLELIRNVILIACTAPGSKAEFIAQASGILRAVCEEIVMTLQSTFPGFHFAPKHSHMVYVFHVDIGEEGGEMEFGPAEPGRLAGSRRRNHGELELELDFLDCDHLLHCFAEAFWRGVQVRGEAKVDITEPSEHEPSRTNLPSATALKESGVKFKRQGEFLPKLERGSTWSSEATLFLPRISTFNHRTEQRWKNLLAFEVQYKRASEVYSFTSYLRFMHDLIKTKKDINVLKEGDGPVFCTRLENDEVLQILSKLRETDYLHSSNSPYWSCLIKEITKLDNSAFRRKDRTTAFRVKVRAAVEFLKGNALCIFVILGV